MQFCNEIINQISLDDLAATHKTDVSMLKTAAITVIIKHL